MNGVFHIVFLITVVIVNIDINFASLTGSNGTAIEDINGETLLKLGRTMDKPLITLFGMAIRNLERLHPCYDWTQWSECATYRKGYISSKTRARKCGRYQVESKTTTETDISICEGFCPKHYNVTNNGFCVKLFTVQKTFDDAEKECQEDGGHMINIDSNEKNDDIKNVLQGFNIHIYIDGRRKDSKSPWFTINGSEKTFFNWASGEPDRGVCIIMFPGNSYWYDSTNGATLRPFICEIKH